MSEKFIWSRMKPSRWTACHISPRMDTIPCQSSWFRAENRRNPLAVSQLKCACEALSYHRHGRTSENVDRKLIKNFSSQRSCLFTLLLSFSLTKGLIRAQTMLKMNGCLTKWTALSRSGIASWMKVSKRFVDPDLIPVICFIDNPSKSMMTTTPLICEDFSCCAMMCTERF